MATQNPISHSEPNGKYVTFISSVSIATHLYLNAVLKAEHLGEDRYWVFEASAI